MPTDDLLPYIFGDTRRPLAVQFARWLQAAPRFRAFAETYRDKIRKKVRGVADLEGARDLEAELAVAYFLLGERRCTLEYEKYSAGRQRGPDFTVTFKTHILFNVEVTRLRGTVAGTSADPNKLVNSLCAKLGQLPPGMINVLVLVTEDAPYSGEDLAGVVRLLDERATHKDEEFFIRRGFLSARDFLKQYSRLSAIRLSGPDGAAVLWQHPQTRHPLPRDIAIFLGK